MAKKQSFADKASKHKHLAVCPVCETELSRIKWVKAVKSETGVRYKTLNVGVCKCNQAEVYG